MGDVEPDPHSDSDSDSDPELDRIDVLAEEYAARCRRGEAPSVSEYAARYPESADRIRAMLTTVALMEQWKQQRRSPHPTEAEASEAEGAAGLRRLGDLRIVREIGRGGM